MTRHESAVKAGLARKAQLGPDGYHHLGGGRPKKVKPVVEKKETRIQIGKSMPEKMAQIRRLYPNQF